MKNLPLLISTFLLCLISLFLAPSAHAAFFSFSSDNTTPKVNDEFTITVKLDTEGKLTNAADLIALYNKDLFQILSISFGTLYSTSFSQINTNGSVALSAAVSDASQGFSGLGTYATLRVKALATGTASFTADCNPSSVWLKGGNGEDLLSCDKNQSLPITINNQTQATPTPTPTPPPAGGPTGGSTIYVPYRGVCTSAQPPTPTGLSAAPGPGNGQITLTWVSVSPVTHYGINYGTRPGIYTRGAGNVGATPTFTVSNLNPATTYYFSVYAVNDCATSPLSVEAWATAPISNVSATDTSNVTFIDFEASQSAPSTPSADEISGQTPLTMTDEGVREQTNNRLFNPFVAFLVISALVFLIILYILGKKRRTDDIEPHHGNPVEHTHQTISNHDEIQTNVSKPLEPEVTPEIQNQSPY